MSSRSEPPLIVWLANRFRCMSVAEMGYRVKQACRSRLTQRSARGAPAAIRSDALQADWTLLRQPAGIDAAPYLLEADSILAGNVLLFSHGQFHAGRVPQWNQCPATSSSTSHGSGMAFSGSNPAPGTDIKQIWELNRHLHWVRLAQAHVLSGEPRYCLGLASQINSWLEQCPPFEGPNWTSSLELAIRLVNWSVVWQMLGGWDGVLFKEASGEQLRSRWLDSIYFHCQFISRNFSRHSSANNHLTGELAGLYVAARTWPYWHQSRNWGAQAKAELEREAVLQHFADGVNREQAVGYQAFTCECLTVAGLCGLRSADLFSDEFWHTLQRAYRFLRSVRDVGGNFPMLGDADDGAMLRLVPRDGNGRVAKLLALGDAVFCVNPAQGRSDMAKWLLGDAASGVATQVDEASTAWQFPEGGYFLFGANFGEPDEIKGMVDCGPLGYLGIAAHGHADALAVQLSIAGEACLVDPGTFSYWCDYPWRAYFRGTSAHNTVRVDGVDQSISGGRFMWTRKAKATIERAPSSPTQFDFAGSHDGYGRLRDPVRHRRQIGYDDSHKRLSVKDDVVGKAAHTVEQFWHFAPHIQVQLTGGGAVARGRRFELQMHFLPQNLHLELIRGNENPPSGWFSRGYGSKEPTTVLSVRTVSNAVSIEVQLAIKVL